VPLSYRQAIAGVSVRSPDPPGRMAIARLAWLPAVRNTRPPPATGLGIGWLWTPFVRQSSVPVFGSYAITTSAPDATSSARFPALTTIGVAQLRLVVRAARHTSLPFVLSSATIAEFAPISWSICRMSRLSYRIGDVPGPRPAFAMLPSDFFHASLPLKSYA